MGLYSYTARDHNGTAVSGTQEADSPAKVAEYLAHNGATPIRISEVTVATGPDMSTRLSEFFEPKVKLEEVVMLCRQLRTLIKAGVPILRSLQGLAETNRNPAMKRALGDIHNQLRGGREFYSALAQHPKVFSPLFIALVKVGESSGRLDEAFAQLADYLTLEKETRERIRSVLRYPMIVISAILVAVVIINIWVVPAFADAFARYDTELPLMTQILIGSSNLFMHYWEGLLAGFVVAVFAVRHWLKTERGAYLWSKWILKVPLIGALLHKALLGRFTQSMGLALKSGVPLVHTLHVVAGVVDNPYVAEKVSDMREGIEKGDTIVRTAAATGMFTPLVLQMLSVGEESGSLDQLLSETAEHYQDEVEYEMKRLADAIEPIMIVIIGIMVAVLALGVFLPLWDLSSAAHG